MKDKVYGIITTIITAWLIWVSVSIINLQIETAILDTNMVNLYQPLQDLYDREK